MEGDGTMPVIEQLLLAVPALITSVSALIWAIRRRA